MDIPLILIVTGIAANNLMVVNISGNGIAITKKHRWILILLLFFIIQNEVIVYGVWFAEIFHPFIENFEFWLSVGILFSISMKMLQELKMRNIRFDNI